MTGAAIYRRGFSIVEAAVSTVIVAVMLVAALNAVASSRMSQATSSRLAIAHMLAEDLLSEIMQQPYVEEGTSSFGPSSGQLQRRQFQDVDDYSGWNESPPQYRDGSEIPGMAGYSRSVAVVWVRSDDLGVSATETHLKQITITVKHDQKPLSELTALRANVE